MRKIILTLLAIGLMAYIIFVLSQHRLGELVQPSAESGETTAIDSQFENTFKGWNRRGSAKWGLNEDDGYYYTSGRDDLFASSYYKTERFSRFDFEVRIKREGKITDGFYPANYLAFLMGENIGEDRENWYPGFLFGITKNGMYSIWKNSTDGTSTAIQPWTISSWIDKEGWNTLRVVADGGEFTCYINEKLVKRFNDTSFTEGFVGFEMYKQVGTKVKFMVDWATLTIPEEGAIIMDEVDAKQEELNQAALESGEAGSPEGISE